MKKPSVESHSAEEWDDLISKAADGGDYRKAIALANAALKADPDGDAAASLLNNRGNHQSELGLKKEAEASYRAALKLDPELPEAQQNLSNALLDRKQNDEDEKLLLAWVHEHPDRPFLCYDLGVLAGRRGNKQQALEALGAALRLKPEWASEASKEYVELRHDPDFKKLVNAKGWPPNPFPWFLPKAYTTRPAPVDLRKRFPELKSKPAIRLHPRSRGPLPQDASKIGGVFLLNAKGTWPLCKEHGTHYAAVLQIRAADVPHFPFPKKMDLFQLLWCPRDHDSAGYAPKIEARWLNTKNLGKSARAASNPPAKTPEHRYDPTECALFPETLTDFPDRWELRELEEEFNDDDALRKLAKKLDPKGGADGAVAYQFCIGAAQGTKLGGYPDWVQDPEYPSCPKCKAQMEHYLTIASWEWDGMSFHRWKPVEEGQPDRASGGHQEDAGLTIGDAGNLYVFVCRDHDAWPVAQIMQCS